VPFVDDVRKGFRSNKVWIFSLFPTRKRAESGNLEGYYDAVFAVVEGEPSEEGWQNSNTNAAAEQFANPTSADGNSAAACARLSDIAVPEIVVPSRQQAVV